MNLAVTCARHFEQDATDEIGMILGEMGDDTPRIEESDLSGILLIKTIVDPVEVCRMIREKIHDEPWTIRYVLRVIPIYRWIRTDLKGIVAESVDLAGAIPKDGKYRITIEKRNSNVSSSEIISGIADAIQRDVSLEKPDRIILVEIFGAYTGVSILEKGDVLSVEREKRQISE